VVVVVAAVHSMVSLTKRDLRLAENSLEIHYKKLLMEMFPYFFVYQLRTLHQQTKMVAEEHSNLLT
jgi:hypothetical protein